MHKLARQKHILDRLSETGQLSISELVAELQVSADTIRRDLSDLEQQGVLQKSHGGAIALNVPAMTRQGRNALLTQTKQRLGQQVAARIPSGSTLFLDAGSTLLAVAAQLKGPLTVITASLDIAQLFSDRADIQLILLGGQWDSKQRLFAGSATLSLVTRYRADIAILGACALHTGLGLSASQEADADVKRAMLAASAEHWLVADRTKLNRCEPWRVAGLSDIHHLFLDRPWAELGMTPPSLYILLTLNNVENLMSNNTINIALIGYGFVGKTFHAPLIRSVPGLNLAFVASRDEEKVKRDLPDVTVIASRKQRSSIRTLTWWSSPPLTPRTPRWPAWR